MLEGQKLAVFTAAKEYIEKGWAVLPLHTMQDGVCTCEKGAACERPAKHPRTPRGLKNASKDLAQIEKWFGENAPLSNIGILTGAESGITVLDLDIKDNKNGWENLKAICGEKGVPNTLNAQTGSGGYHLFFKYNSALKNDTNIFGDGIDCRNDGGFIVAAPSVHKSGGVYSWLNAGTELADLPSYLTQIKKPRKSAENKKIEFDLNAAEKCLEKIDNTNYEKWRGVGIILGRHFAQSDDAWNLYVTWSQKNYKQDEGCAEKMREAFYDLSAQKVDNELTIANLIDWSGMHGYFKIESDNLDWSEFIYYAPTSKYYDLETGAEYTTEKGVAIVLGDAEKGYPKVSNIKKYNCCTQKAKLPQFKEKIIRGKYVNLHGELVENKGRNIHNIYLHPTIFDEPEYKEVEKEFDKRAFEFGNENLLPMHFFLHFILHVHQLFNQKGDAQQVLKYLAHRVQKPWEKPRFALLIAGGQGVGKDTVVNFASYILGGEHNVASIEAHAIFNDFNAYADKTLIRINELAFNDDFQNKFNFENNLKGLIAGAPDHIIVNPKYHEQYTHKLNCGVIITTNFLTRGVHISDDDRRYDVIESNQMRGLFNPWLKKQLATENNVPNADVVQHYFDSMYNWFEKGKCGDDVQLKYAGKYYVAAYLKNLNISDFKVNSQRRTEAWHRVVSQNISGTAWIDMTLDDFKRPMVLNYSEFCKKARDNYIEHFQVKEEKDKPSWQKLRPQIVAGLERAGYIEKPNPEHVGKAWNLSYFDLQGFQRKGRVIIYTKREFMFIEGSDKTLQLQKILDDQQKLFYEG